MSMCWVKIETTLTPKVGQLTASVSNMLSLANKTFNKKLSISFCLLVILLREASVHLFLWCPVFINELASPFFLKPLFLVECGEWKGLFHVDGQVLQSSKRQRDCWLNEPDGAVWLKYDLFNKSGKINQSKPERGVQSRHCTVPIFGETLTLIWKPEVDYSMAPNIYRCVYMVNSVGVVTQEK